MCVILSLPGILRDHPIHKTWSMASFDAIPTLPDGHERKWLSFSFFETSKRRKRQRTQIGETLERGRKDAGDAFQHSSRQRGTLKKIGKKKKPGNIITRATWWCGDDMLSEARPRVCRTIY